MGSLRISPSRALNLLTVLNSAAIVLKHIQSQQGFAKTANSYKLFAWLRQNPAFHVIFKLLGGVESQLRI